MSDKNLGKKFEGQFKKWWKATVPDGFILRLIDTQSGYKGAQASNPCDFVCFSSGHLLLVECKEHKGNTLGWGAVRQYEKLLSYKGIKGVHPGVLVWFSKPTASDPKVIWCPIEELEKMHIDGKKSVNIKMLEEKEYDLYEVPSVQLPTFMKSDYSKLIEHLLEE